VVTGGSAGGHLASLVALTRNDPAFQPGFEGVDTSVSACVPFYGVYDLADVFEGRRGPARASHRFERMLMGTTVDDDRTAFEQASPLHHVSEDDPPFFVIHGTNDNLVPVAQARQFVEALRSVSREPVLYAEVPGASHAFEIFNSVRTANAVFGVERFLAWLYSAYRARHPEAPAEPVREASA
jgi:acetyl esterase/lipase